MRDENNKELLEIKVEGKTEKVCQKMMDQLKGIYIHMVRYTEIK